MLQDQNRYFGREIVNSSGEFSTLRSEISDRNKPKHMTVLPRYLKLNLWQEEKENIIMCIEEEPSARLTGYDSTVAKDPQYTPLYNQEIFSYLLQQEGKYVVKNYITPEHQPDLNARMRAILIDWLVDVHLKFRLKDETLYVTVQLIDRYLSLHTTTRCKLQLVGVSALFIACKYEEIYPPDLKDFVYITDNAYTKQDVLEMEGLILQALNFCITQPSTYCFLQRFGRIAGLDQKNLHLSQYILELALIETKFMGQKASFLACAAIYLVTKIRKITPCWSEELQSATRYEETDLRETAKGLCAMLQSSDKNSLQAVRKKFALIKYLEVSRIKVERQKTKP